MSLLSLAQARKPCPHVCSTSLSPSSPHLLNQAPPSAQQVSLPFSLGAHLGHVVHLPRAHGLVVVWHFVRVQGALVLVPVGLMIKHHINHHLDSIQSTKPEIITSAGRSALEPRVSFSFAKIPTFLAPRTSVSATSESTLLVRGALRTHRSRCRSCHGFRRSCSE